MKRAIKIVVVSIVVILMLGILIGCGRTVDNTHLNSSELKELLIDMGYEFRRTGTQFTNMIALTNGEILIQKIDSTILDDMLTFSERNINEQIAQILDTSSNDTDELQAQYDAYLEWLAQMGITEAQLKDVLAYYRDMGVRETIEFLKSRGYRFSMSDENMMMSRVPIVVAIAYESVLAEYMIVFVNVDVNEGATFVVTHDMLNETSAQEEQRIAYLEWIEDLGLTEEELKEALIYYYENHMN